MKDLTIKKSVFIDWMYSDYGSSQCREFFHKAISELRTGEFKLTAQEVFENCEWIPLYHTEESDTDHDTIPKEWWMYEDSEELHREYVKLIEG